MLCQLLKCHTIDPQKYRLLIFNKGAKRVQWSKESLFINDAETTGHSRAKKKKKSRPELTPFTHTQNNSKWVIELNMISKTVNSQNISSRKSV